MKNSVATVMLVAAGALTIPVSATARNYTQIATATVTNVNSNDSVCKRVANASATGRASGTNLHRGCTEAKNVARENLRNRIPTACAKYISSTKRCKNG